MRRPTLWFVAAVALLSLCNHAAFAAEQPARARLLEFIKKFRITAWSNGQCTAFAPAKDPLTTVYGMIVTVDADSQVAAEERNGIMPMAIPSCPNQVARVALLSWPKDLVGGSYLVAVELEGAVALKTTPKFRVLGVAGNTPVDAELENAVFDLATLR
jgi:hypothetical protein